MVVVEERGTSAGLRQAPQETRRERGRAAPRRRLNRVSGSPKPQVYIGGGEGLRPHLGFPRGGGSPLRSHLGLGAAAKGEECLPSQVEALPFRVSPLPCAWALGGWCPWPIKARAPPYSPCCCIGRGGTFSGILRNLPKASRYNTEKPELFPEPEQQLSIYKSLPSDHSGTPRDVRDLIRDSEQHSVTTYMLSL